MDEWRRAYINYRGLKKLIKRVAEHRAVREALEQSEAQSSGAHSVQNSATRLLARSKTRLFLRGSRQDGGYGATSQHQGDALTVPNVTLKGTGLRLLDESRDAEAEAPYHLFFGKPTNEPERMDDDEEMGGENVSGVSTGEGGPLRRRSSTWVVPQADRT